MKHTPGPWTYAGNTSSTATVTAPRRLVTPDSLYGAPDAPAAVATCRGNSEIRKANAVLIAAAPDLLAACQELVRKVDCGEARSVRSYAQMKAAIAKATS